MDRESRGKPEFPGFNAKKNPKLEFRKNCPKSKTLLHTGRVGAVNVFWRILSERLGAGPFKTGAGTVGEGHGSMTSFDFSTSGVFCHNGIVIHLWSANF